MRPLPRPYANERGIALVTALLITLLMTLVVVALSYRVGMFSLGAREHVVKSQSIYTAEVGLNQARYALLSRDCIPPNWGACLPGINDTKFTNISTSLRQVFTFSGQTDKKMAFTVGGKSIELDAARRLTLAGLPAFNFNVYAKTTNIPKVINIIAVSDRSSEQVQTVIDAGLIFTKPIGSGYKQGGQDESKTGQSGESLGGDATNVSSTF